MIDWTAIIVAVITSLLAGGSIAGIITARATAKKTLAGSWAEYAKNLEQALDELKEQVKEIPALKAAQQTMAAEISSLQSENILLKAQVDILTAWNQDYKEWGRLLSMQVIELGGVPKPFKRQKRQNAKTDQQ